MHNKKLKITSTGYIYIHIVTPIRNTFFLYGSSQQINEFPMTLVPYLTVRKKDPYILY